MYVCTYWCSYILSYILTYICTNYIMEHGNTFMYIIYVRTYVYMYICSKEKLVIKTKRLHNLSWGGVGKRIHLRRRDTPVLAPSTYNIRTHHEE